MDLFELGAEFVVQGIPSDDLRDRACAVLLAGYESSNLASLAGAEKDVHPAELRALFVKGLEEVGVRLPDRLGAAAILKRTYARQVVDGSASPRAGAARIVGLLHDLEPDLPKGERFVGDSFGVALIIGLYYGLDDTAAHTPAVLRELVEGHRFCVRAGRTRRGREQVTGKGAHGTLSVPYESVRAR
jgi:hypothetical protein